MGKTIYTGRTYVKDDYCDVPTRLVASATRDGAATVVALHLVQAYGSMPIIDVKLSRVETRALRNMLDEVLNDWD